MNIYRVEYTGNSRRFKGSSWNVYAATEREAVITFYTDYLHENCFPDDMGRLLDMDGDLICDLDDNRVRYDGGYFVAQLIKEL